MEYSTHVFIQQPPTTEQNFESKLQDVSDQITTNGCICPNVFAPFTNLAVQQAVVSSRHIAFLLQDGRICRISFRIQADKIEPNSTEATKTKPKQVPSQIARPQSRQSIHRLNNFDRPTFENLVLSSSGSSIAPITNTNGQLDLLPQLQAGYPLNRRHHLIRTARGRTGIIFGSRPLIPASSVPEELIEQVQVVLQGKSRNTILRELQRTSLDVNMAVNNLLARDNEGDEDFDDDYVGADLISLLDVNPHNEHPGLILESEFFDEPEFALRYSSIQRRVVSARLANAVNNTSTSPSSTLNPSLPDSSTTNANPSAIITSSTTSNDRDRKRSRYDPRWLDGSLREELFGRIDRELKPDDLSIVKDSNTKTNSSIRKEHSHHYQHQHSAPAAILTSTSSSSPQNAILFGDQLQFWTDANCDNIYPRFTHIACLYSELIAINTNGQLCQWNWHDDYPYQDSDNSQIRHPKTLILQLFNEKIINLSANLIRATILTETNRIATWIDESLGSQINLKFQHSLQEFSSARIIDIQTSSLYTIFRTETNDLYWYGLLPHKPRRKLLERLKDKTRHKNRTNNQQQIIAVGCLVCLISNPYYNQGAWAFYVRDGQPKLGQLMEQAWILSNTARFRIKTFELIPNKIKDDDKSSLEMPPPPSPASSTCSVDSNTSFASSLKRKKQHTNSSAGANPFLAANTDSDSNEQQQQHSKIKDEEYWPLDEVVFIEDCRVAPIGKVMKIDGSLVLVKFPSKNNNDTTDPNIEANNLENCRILRKDDLLVVKGNQAPKTPDCTLSLPNSKRISLENGTLLTFSVDKDYLHTLQLRDTTIYYIMYEVGSNNGLCRAVRQNSLPLINNRQSLLSFIGENKNLLRLHTLNSLDIPPRVLIDSNRLIYSLIYNQENSNIKDPQWKNLLAINYFSQGIIPIKNIDQANKNPIILSIMQIQKGILIPHILRYDIDKIRSILNEIELNRNQDLLKLILDEHIDGFRNLFHACVHIAIPSTNKEYLITDEQIQNETNNSNNLKRISFAIDFLHSQSTPDHNDANATRMNNSSNVPEQQITSWPPVSSSNESTDAPPPPSSSPRRSPHFSRSASTTGAAAAAATTTTTTNAGSLSPSYTSTSLSSKIQYLQSQVIQQQANQPTAPPNYPGGSIAGSVRSVRPNANEFMVWSSCKYDEREKRLRAIKILRLLLDCPLLQEHLLSLLSFRNFEGQTPFMLAIQSRAYQSASILFEYAVKIAKRESSEEQSSTIQFFLESSTIEIPKLSYRSLLLQMIYPLASNNSDNSPLYTLCTNDTCSFTWTGEEHISQAIFECKTCGLSGTLCCCSECAQTCHKGHDCRLKRTSPTAYCDCWEVCKCKSLIAGDQQKRFELLKLLLNETNLVEIKNSRYENLLLYLVQTVGRQMVEQQQFVRTATNAILQQQARKTREQLLNSASIITGSSALSKKLQNQIASSGIINTNASNPLDIESTTQTNNIPDHHLEPPQFCRRALEFILTDWSSVKSMLLCGCPDDIDPTTIKTNQTYSPTSQGPPAMSAYNNENIFSLDEQQQTSQLDRFTYLLLVKCNTIKQTNSTTSKTSTTNDLLDILLNTLLREMTNPINRDMARYVAARFVRSVIRLFIILSLQILSEKTSTTNSTVKRHMTNTNLSSSSILSGSQTILLQCKRVFQTLTLISVHALAHTADLLISPVRHGIVKPIAMFNLLSTHTDILQSLDEIFNIDSEYYRAYHRFPTATNEDLNDTNTDNTNIDLTEDDDNNSDTQSQHEINNPTTTNMNINERQSRVPENLASSLSDNESEMELELLAESDTDNESNHSAPNTNTHRTSATAGSENMALFSDDENSDSDDADSVRSDSVLGEGDETSQHEPMLFDDARDALAVAAATTSGATTTNDRLVSVPPVGNVPAGSNVQTANSTTNHLNVQRLSNRAAITGSIFGDNNPSRRQMNPMTTSSSSANLTNPASSQQLSQPAATSMSVNTTNSLLARAFGILIRQITDLLVRLPTTLSASSLYHDVLSTATTIDEQNTVNTIQKEIEQCLLPTWQWFATILDSFESQVRFGMTLSNLVHNEADTTLHGNRFLKNLIERTQIEIKKKSTTNRITNTSTNTSEKPANNRLDFLNYSLSLMRSIHEHGDQEPPMDVLSYKHFAYLLDAFIYYFRENGLNEMNKSIVSRKETNEETSTNEEPTDPNRITSNDSFFHRSSSTLCLSSLGPDPFQITIDDSLPLACRPQLLQPVCRKEDLFGRFLYDQTAAKYSHLPAQLSVSNRTRMIPDFLQPNYLNLFSSTIREGKTDKTNTKTRDDDRMAVDVLLDLSSGLGSSDKSRTRPSINHSILLNGSYEYLLARWRFSIELFVKLFLDDVGIEPGSIINESSGFSAREQRFRHDMERIKNTHQKDIRFEAMERDRILLIQKTFRTLNSYFYRNQNISSSLSSVPPLAVQRVKVTFKDEPGEGSGVARSFYASIVEAILSEEKFPILELSSYGGSSTGQSLSGGLPSSHAHHQRLSRERRTVLATYLRSDRRSSAMLLSSEARPFRLNLPPSTEPTITNNPEPLIIEHWTPSKIKLGLNIYPKVAALQPSHAEKITGMLLEGLPTPQLQRIINVEEDLKSKVDEAMTILTAFNARETQQNDLSTTNERLLNNKTLTFDKQLNDYAPLFWQPEKRGVYAPRPGKCTPERLMAYRNVGRLIGLCLLQNELFPLPLCRHVIKYMLNRTIRWHDLAFFDSTMYENLRRMAFDAEKNESQYVTDLHLTFSMTVTEKEGGETYDLITDGSTKDVTYSNLYEFIKRYAEFRMVHLVEQSLQHLRLGVFDVLPSTSLDYLSPEDFRLLLNGTSNINITTLMAYTTFNDESGETTERINQFKKWFWSVLEKFSPLERQDLIYFWTGSPALPASEAGFQPQPSVTIRPADDQHLPTANTCISRLYVPLYSSKTILKLKLQYAIKTKMFGFV
ncbi:unnamed protein product [Rotaria socialis]